MYINEILQTEVDQMETAATLMTTYNIDVVRLRFLEIDISKAAVWRTIPKNCLENKEYKKMPSDLRCENNQTIINQKIMHWK